MVFIGARDGYILGVTPVGAEPPTGGASILALVSSAAYFLVAGLPGLGLGPAAGRDTETSVKILVRFVGESRPVEQVITDRTADFAIQAPLKIRNRSEDETRSLELSWNYAEPHQVAALVDAVVDAVKCAARPLAAICEMCRTGTPVSVALCGKVPRYVCGVCQQRGGCRA